MHYFLLVHVGDCAEQLFCEFSRNFLSERTELLNEVGKCSPTHELREDENDVTLETRAQVPATTDDTVRRMSSTIYM